jgi:hypothetical protein
MVRLALGFGGSGWVGMKSSLFGLFWAAVTKIFGLRLGPKSASDYKTIL